MLAVLGPTDTGMTRLAAERTLGRRGGANERLRLKTERFNISMLSTLSIKQ